MNDKKLKVEMMEAFDRRRDQIMKRAERGFLSQEKAAELIEAIDEEEANLSTT